MIIQHCGVRQSVRPEVAEENHITGRVVKIVRCFLCGEVLSVEIDEPRHVKFEERTPIIPRGYSQGD